MKKLLLNTSLLILTIVTFIGSMQVVNLFTETQQNTNDTIININMRDSIAYDSIREQLCLPKVDGSYINIQVKNN